MLWDEVEIKISGVLFQPFSVDFRAGTVLRNQIIVNKKENKMKRYTFPVLREVYPHRFHQKEIIHSRLPIFILYLCLYMYFLASWLKVEPVLERNLYLKGTGVFATNSIFVILISFQPDDVNLWYFKLTLFDLTAFIVWNIKGLRHWVAMKLKLEN